MRGAGAVDDDGPLVALRQSKAAVGQGSAESMGRSRRPCSGENDAQVGSGNFGALGNMAAFG